MYKEKSIKNTNKKESKKCIKEVENCDKKNQKLGAFYYYKNNMFRKHFVIYIISLLIFSIVFIYTLSTYTPKFFLENLGSVVSVNTVMKEFAIFSILAVLLGIIPYMYLPVVTVIYSARLSYHICNLLFMKSSNKTIVTIIAIFMLLILSFAISIGMNVCKIITSKINKKIKILFKRKKGENNEN